MDIYPDEDDPIIVELRRFRREYFARFGGDLEAMAADRKRFVDGWRAGGLSFLKKFQKEESAHREKRMDSDNRDE